MSTCKDRENFKVAVRVRPQIPREVSSGSTEVTMEYTYWHSRFSFLTNCSA